MYKRQIVNSVSVETVVPLSGVASVVYATDINHYVTPTAVTAIGSVGSVKAFTPILLITGDAQHIISPVRTTVINNIDRKYSVLSQNNNTHVVSKDRKTYIISKINTS